MLDTQMPDRHFSFPKTVTDTDRLNDALHDFLRRTEALELRPDHPQHALLTAMRTLAKLAVKA